MILWPHQQAATAAPVMEQGLSSSMNQNTAWAQTVGLDTMEVNCSQIAQTWATMGLLSEEDATYYGIHITDVNNVDPLPFDSDPDLKPKEICTHEAQTVHPKQSPPTSNHADQSHLEIMNSISPPPPLHTTTLRSTGVRIQEPTQYTSAPR
ncbi:hypothetical protein FRX31_028163 [Thalictrum thalictroides]|uniref:Uncharacterized protein n=1 Tax=Thalictrum thalictroides TaxID=46969 RepID=A0A7J6VC63_THATH|nr:hypothetical protein FRX31_028163 [Thalictrum thalictroides]